MLESLVLWFARNYYAMALLCVPVFVFFWGLKKRFEKAPDPIVSTLIVGVAIMLLLPTYDRFDFERKTSAGLKMGRSFAFKIVKTEPLRDIAEPLTWFIDFTGVYMASMPKPLTYEQGKYGSFDFRTMVYGQHPEKIYVDARCRERTVDIQARDRQRVFQTVAVGQEMDEFQFRVFCETDYREQIDYLRLSE